MQKWKFLLVFAVMSVVFAFSAYADADYDGYLMRFKDESSREQAMKYIAETAMLLSDEEPVSEIYEPENLYKTNDENLAKAFEEMGLLEYYEPNAVAYLFDYDYTADYYYKAYQSTWAHACSNAPGAWKYGAYGNSVKVAVVDSGVMGTHEELTGRVKDGASFITNSPATTAVIGHGTAVAGIIGAAANGKGIVGVAHRVEIVPIKVTDTDSFSAALLYLAVDEAIKQDVDIINLSLGTKTDSTGLKGAIDKAVANGIIVVAASGNTTSYPQGTLVYPGSYDNVISVGNLMRSGSLYVISSTSIANSQVTISAPGTSVYTTSNSSTSSYAAWSGTSFACPYVAGIAALAKSVDPDITQAEFTELLISTADKDVLEGAERLDTYGYGIANAGALIEALIDRRQKGGFISPIDKTESNGTNVKVYNPGDETAAYSFVAKVHAADRPISFAVKSITLDPGAVTEIPLASLQGADTSSISCYLLEPFKMKPLYKRIDI